MAESILNGHLYIDYPDIDPKLLALDNPYDFEARKAAEVSYHWDHAFYNGRYYMYFGIVPVFLLFLPYRFLTGTNLTTYHATQIFVSLFICGIFTTFYTLVKTFFRRMSLSIYLALSVAFSIVSVWYSTAAPALYCRGLHGDLEYFLFPECCFLQHRRKAQHTLRISRKPVRCTGLRVPPSCRFSKFTGASTSGRISAWQKNNI